MSRTIYQVLDPDGGSETQQYDPVKYRPFNSPEPKPKSPSKISYTINVVKKVLRYLDKEAGRRFRSPKLGGGSGSSSPAVSSISQFALDENTPGSPSATEDGIADLDKDDCSSLLSFESCYSLPGLTPEHLDPKDMRTPYSLKFRYIRASYVYYQAREALPTEGSHHTGYPHLFRGARLSFPLVPRMDTYQGGPGNLPGPARVVYCGEEDGRKSKCEVWFHDPRKPKQRDGDEHPFTMAEYRAGKGK
ncbi:hypothetical protein QBC34DRAFT_469578 [Podospora aff. communis PSN243]|uniref:Uncharacterized protein n=1 Tax=Podospora aff. communis PSN243 TaxID=3040156 RepID=A0AAV9GDK4_9PEZI|nr:hypothetical protein QBC34DRAFT_469578 [Podospora aff. communis PSN243]